MIRCGSYLRISREHHQGEQNESDSIVNQRLVIRNYLEQHPEMQLVREWVDDGYSGSSFDRPGVQEMLNCAGQGEIDCILVKDLSRFGREYIDTGRYLQRILPLWGIRFIAVSDGYDSAKSARTEEALLLPIMNLMNDAYCHDISRKVRSGQEAKRKKGDFIGAFPVFGYRKDPDNHNRLLIDEPAAQVVRKIFCWRSQGKSAEKIQVYLEELAIPSPYTYKLFSGSRFVSGFSDKERTEWYPAAVRRILKNEIYIGTLQQGREQKISYKMAKRKKLPKEQWICVDGAVPAIVSKNLFMSVQKMGQKRRPMA